MARKTTPKAAPVNNGFMDWLSKQGNNIKSYLPDSKTVANAGKQMQSGAKSIANTLGKITPTQAVQSGIRYAKANPAKAGLVGGMLTAAYDPLKTYVTDPAIKYIEQGLNSAADTIIDKYGNKSLHATKIPDRPKEVPLMTAEEYANSMRKTEQPSGSKSTAPTKGLGQAPQQIKRKELTQQKVQQQAQAVHAQAMSTSPAIDKDALEFEKAYDAEQKLKAYQGSLVQGKNFDAMSNELTADQYPTQAELDTQARYNQLAKSIPAADKYDYIRNSGIGEDAENAHIENVMKQEKAKVMSGLSKEDQASFMQYLANK